jgi:3-hydroxyacyl-CoA dehydrogenase/enoyl-CoA hydratase/3-hydroxybutyryl-CoA epimerase
MSVIRKVCVIGSGVMGSGIAAQVANSRTEVILLDIADENSSNPSNIVVVALEKMQSQKPAPLSHPRLAKYITVGNLRDNLNLISECDLIIEVIIERLDIKHDLYQTLLPYLKESAIIASNTSTLPLAKLKEKLPKSVQRRFIITHFFNPPRYMELLELVCDGNNDRLVSKPAEEFITKKLGKTIINCNDTPGFIANRIGCFLLELTVRKAIEKELNPALIDQIFTKLLGFPSTGIFGLYDLIGHDVMALISKSLTSALDIKDKYHEIYTESEILSVMKSRGLLGRKSGGGFYKVTKNQGKAIKQIFDFKSLDYVELKLTDTPKTLQELFNNNDIYSDFFKEILANFFSYITSLVPEISDSTEDIDKAMKLGYSLKYGPFELLDSYMPKGEIWLKGINNNIKKQTINKSTWQDSAKILLSNDSADLFEYKNNHIFVIKTKMNSLNHQVFALIIDSVKLSEDKSSRLIIHPSKSKHFSAGADIRLFYDQISNKNFKAIEQFIDLGQKSMLALKYADIDVISCAYGLALGGGCELLLHSHCVVAHQNLNAGLVELGVGLIPGWGGVKEMFLRSEGDKNRLIQNLRNILVQYQSASSDYFALEYNVNCNFNMSIENIMAEAIEVKPVTRITTNSVNLPRINLASEMDTANFDNISGEVLEFFQKIIDMGKIDESTLLSMEKEKFLQMAAKPASLEKIGRLLSTK